jgi:CRP/FNR family transcriptional regulator, anaerobic regulatory protein
MQTERLRKTINAIVNLKDEEWNIVQSHLEICTLNKNDFFLKQGETCNYIAFVDSGTLVYYKLSETGTEITTDFAFAGDWITDNRSRLKNSPSLLNIKAIEKTELMAISSQNLTNCYNQVPKLEKVGRMLIEQAFIKISQQSIDLQTLSATERHDKMLQEYPEIFRKVPLYHIANYLGIAPKSLSRIRKEKLKR